jgi:hypothetical protein
MGLCDHSTMGSVTPVPWVYVTSVLWVYVTTVPWDLYDQSTMGRCVPNTMGFMWPQYHVVYVTTVPWDLYDLSTMGSVTTVPWGICEPSTMGLGDHSTMGSM